MVTQNVVKFEAKGGERDTVVAIVESFRLDWKVRGVPTRTCLESKCGIESSHHILTRGTTMEEQLKWCLSRRPMFVENHSSCALGNFLIVVIQTTSNHCNTIWIFLQMRIRYDNCLISLLAQHKIEIKITVQSWYYRIKRYLNLSFWNLYCTIMIWNEMRVTSLKRMNSWTAKRYETATDFFQILKYSR